MKNIFENLFQVKLELKVENVLFFLSLCLNLFGIVDIKSKSKNINIINGGRYDKLISDLGSKKQVPAVGAALNLNY